MPFYTFLYFATCLKQKKEKIEISHLEKSNMKTRLNQQDEFTQSFCLTNSNSFKLHLIESRLETMLPMAIRVVEFSNGGTKLGRFLPKNQPIQN